MGVNSIPASYPNPNLIVTANLILTLTFTLCSQMKDLPPLTFTLTLTLSLTLTLTLTFTLTLTLTLNLIGSSVVAREMVYNVK